jgi:hypothetical protein
LLHEFAAYRASHSVIVMQVLNARGAQSVTAVNQNAGDTFAHIVSQTAELADVQAPSGII